jgi:hypothetical protein
VLFKSELRKKWQNHFDEFHEIYEELDEWVENPSTSPPPWTPPFLDELTGLT